MHPDIVRVIHERTRVASHVLVLGAMALGFGGVLPRHAGAQLVTPKTVPVFQNQQFAILPSATAGMGGVSIATDDSITDAFVNPAKAARLREGIFFSAPYSHHVSGDRGGGRTLPLGGIATFGDWAIGGTFAVQQLDRAGPMGFSQAISDRTANNQYLMLSAARRLGAGLSIGAGGSFAGLDAVDGVDLLYPGSDRIQQRGSSSDLRVGLTKAFAGERTLELLILRNQFDVTHDVNFRNVRWDTLSQGPIVTDRAEHNEDRTRIWGVHAEYTRPVGDAGWRIGWLATVNQISHPKIPNYVLQSIPRDPGGTLSGNAGVGLARTFGATTFGLDLILEPMRSITWADAANDTAIVGGGMIPAGGKTVENEFAFTNSIVRAGLGHQVPVTKDSSSMFEFQLGLGVYSINYHLEQTNNVERTYREQSENWIEWTPTIGLAFRTRALQLRYNYSSTCSNRDCDRRADGPVIVFADRVSSAGTLGGGVIAAPSAPLTFNGGKVSLHRLSVSFPIR